MTTIFRSFLMIFLCALQFGCSSELDALSRDPVSARRLPQHVRDEATAIVRGNNRFAVELYGRLKDRDGNVFLSPFSVSAAFSMVYAGARGGTRAEMSRVFHFPGVDHEVHPVFREIRKSLDTGESFNGYRLAIASRLWGHHDYEFRPEFLTVTREHYDAELERVDFVGDAEGARARINAWVEEKTETRIKDLFQPGTIDPKTVLVLADAIYFKGTWQFRFRPADTRTTSFDRSRTEEVMVSMMNQIHDFRIAKLEGFRMLELPYSGGDLSFLVLLPDSVDGLADVESKLAEGGFQSWRERLESTRVSVGLPRFTFTSDFLLSEVLAGMGMPSVFRPGADLTGMTETGDLFISTAVHKAWVDVNEEGTEAAAATGVTVARGDARLELFHVDHPFLFLIHDNVTGSILFLGRVVDPTGE